MMPHWLGLAEEAFHKLDSWKSEFGSFQPESYPSVRAAGILLEVAERLKGNYPFFHPVYAGQMLKPPADIAMAAYALAMTINPNNHALDGGPPSSEMEKEVIRSLGAMLQFGDRPLGHLTSGGTAANMEALWMARNLHPGKPVAFSKAAHYTHSRMAAVLGMETIEIPVADNGKMDVAFFERHAASIGTVVVTMGTTGMGFVEPLDRIVPICKKFGVRIHVDAAYGGFFSLLSKSGLIDTLPWSFLGEADSIVIDPHKHGLQPYGCGAVLFRDPSLGRFYKHDSPYTYFSSDELHLGEISLECSRAGAAAVALWATIQLYPLTETGLGSILSACRRAAVSFAEKLPANELFHMVQPPELDIVTYFARPEKPSISEISALSNRIFTRSMQDRDKPLFLSLYKLDAVYFKRLHPEYFHDAETVTVLRSVLMKPEQEGWVPELIERLHRHHG